MSSATSASEFATSSTLPTFANNSADRWIAALAHFDREREQRVSTVVPDGEGETPAVVAVKATVDVSGSMQGTKLTAVKLGLCALISQLRPTDYFSICIFNNAAREITPGFLLVDVLRQSLPRLLEAIEADGGTAFYDAVHSSLDSMKAFAAFGKDLERQRHVIIALTDGEDNSSASNTNGVMQRLADPGINNFMFIVMAVEMSRTQQLQLRPWSELRHCKQMNVSVNSGATLLSSFSELLASRVFSCNVDRTFRISVGTQRRPPNAVELDVQRPLLHGDFEDELHDLDDRFDDCCSCCEDNLGSPRMIEDDYDAYRPYTPPANFHAAGGNLPPYASDGEDDMLATRSHT
jgi:uncharacterized protein YegL